MGGEAEAGRGTHRRGAWLRSRERWPVGDQGTAESPRDEAVVGRAGTPWLPPRRRPNAQCPARDAEAG